MTCCHGPMLQRKLSVVHCQTSASSEPQAAGTSAHVLLELFGGEGVTPGAGSGVHCLEQGPYQPTLFGPGQTDAFEVSHPLQTLLPNHNPAWSCRLAVLLCWVLLDRHMSREASVPCWKAPLATPPHFCLHSS